VVSRKNYYKNILGYMTHGSSYRNKIFSTQISLELLLETDGQVIHPETGTPQGGTVSPVLAHGYLHYALDLWFDKVVKAHCRGEALLCRYADDWVCAFRYQDDAERFYRVLPQRLKKFNLQVAPEKPHLRRLSRFHPSLQRRFTFLGFACAW